LLHKGGLFLMCDHFAGPGGQSDTDLHLTIDEQRAALESAGFSGITLLSQDHGLAFWRARVG
jgi:predicted methyltransferase